mmetsp:Transcript_26243/g.67824  ORF Transcript_26243/g.67824 Transcript_26243/m.67824 type:complete len:306 (-) Transcript_26243:446-1363(-)
MSSRNPGVPWPASVCTAQRSSERWHCSRSTRRMRWFDVSATSSPPPPGSRQSERGAWKSPTVSLCAAGGLESTEPRAPEPERVVVAPVATSTARITWLFVSATYTVRSSAESATPIGCPKRAARPTPLTGPSTGTSVNSPASVRTRPLGSSTSRMALFSVSATTANAPSDETATPLGEANAASAASPSTWSHSPEPTTRAVDVAPSRSTMRRTLAAVSATSAVGLVDARMPMPRGLKPPSVNSVLTPGNPADVSRRPRCAELLAPALPPVSGETTRSAPLDSSATSSSRWSGVSAIAAIAPKRAL